MLADVTIEEWLGAGTIALGAILAMVFGGRLLRSLLNRRLAEPSLAAALVVRLLRWTILLFGLVYAASVVGVEIGPLIGALGIGGIAIALAVQPALQNLFAGVVLQTERPLDRGEEVSTNGYDGIVRDVTGRALVLLTFDGEVVTIPNSVVLDHPIVNHSREGRRRTRVTVGVSYTTDLDAATTVLRSAVLAADGVLEYPAPLIVASEFGESSIDFQLSFWHRSNEGVEWETRSAVIRGVHTALAEAGITIPFPQRDVHVRPESD